MPPVASGTQRSSNLPESFQVSVAGASQSRVERQQHARLDQDLKAVADAEDQLAGRVELVQAVGQVMANLIAEDPAGGDVVAVAEPARQAENLKVGQQSRAIRAGD